MSADLEIPRLEAHIARLRNADEVARATDACGHLRRAMEVLHPVGRSAELDAIESLMDNAATRLLAILDRGRT